MADGSGVGMAEVPQRGQQLAAGIAKLQENLQIAPEGWAVGSHAQRKNVPEVVEGVLAARTQDGASRSYLSNLRAVLRRFQTHYHEMVSEDSNLGFNS
jgi:hypothetical protein